MIKKFIIILFGLSLYGSAHAASSSYASSSSSDCPQLFNMRYRISDGTWNCKNRVIQDFSSDSQLIPADINMYLEQPIYHEQSIKVSRGSLLPTVGDYFRNFPNLGYLAVKDQKMAEKSGNSNLLGMQKVTLGNIPPFQAQCMRTKKSESLLNCLMPWGSSPTYRVIDLQGRKVELRDVENVSGEGNLFYITYNQNQAVAQDVAEINKHFEKQCPTWRRILDTIYKWRYGVAAGIAATVVGACIYRHHASFVSERLKEIGAITGQLNEQKKASGLLKVIIESANDKQALARMSADKMREILAAHIEIKAVDSEGRRLAALMPSSWTLLDSLSAAIRIKFGVITGIFAGTYLADVFAKYFLGYRPYVSSCIYQGALYGHDSFLSDTYCSHGSHSSLGRSFSDAEKIESGGYCNADCKSCSIKDCIRQNYRDFDVFIPHYDEATERAYKRNQKITAAVAVLAGVYGLYKWSTAQA
jgi:hypothetical protein